MMRVVLFRHLPPWEQAVKATVGHLGLTSPFTPVLDQRLLPKVLAGH